MNQNDMDDYAPLIRAAESWPGHLRARLDVVIEKARRWDAMHGRDPVVDAVVREAWGQAPNLKDVRRDADAIADRAVRNALWPEG
jgi:predicted TIM-barrel enzyme